MSRFIALILGMLLCSGVLAQESGVAGDSSPAVTLPQLGASATTRPARNRGDTEVEADAQDPTGATIRRYYGGTVEEYRLNGEVREIRVRPERAPASYYLVNPDGDLGELEGSRRSRNDAQQKLIPGWRVFSW
ncbi:MAG: DUF2782 domain-containing protein [Candidatus Competibacterales bacterium]